MNLPLLLLLIATNFFFALYFLLAALHSLQFGLYGWCALHVVMMAVNGGMGTSKLSKLWKLL